MRFWKLIDSLQYSFSLLVFANPICFFFRLFLQQCFSSCGQRYWFVYIMLFFDFFLSKSVSFSRRFQIIYFGYSLTDWRVPILYAVDNTIACVWYHVGMVSLLEPVFSCVCTCITNIYAHACRTFIVPFNIDWPVLVKLLTLLLQQYCVVEVNLYVRTIKTVILFSELKLYYTHNQSLSVTFHVFYKCQRSWTFHDFRCNYFTANLPLMLFVHFPLEHRRSKCTETKF